MEQIDDAPTGRAVGGAARARALTPERRKEISLTGVKAKKDKAQLTKVTHTGLLHLGGVEFRCYVTENGERLLSGRSMQEALRLVDEEKPASGQKPGSRMDRFLSAKWINPLIYKDKTPDHFLPVRCVFEDKVVSGYRAEVLADVCEAMLDARAQNLLNSRRRLEIAKQCEVLMRGFSRVGIVAIVDEATGYQKDRARDELAKILHDFVAKEMQPYLSKFPVQFYEEMFRLRGIPFDSSSVRRPLYFGHLTNDIIYRRLAPGVWQEIKAKAKKERGLNSTPPHLHRFLTPEIGDPKLRNLIIKVTTAMQLSDDWKDFKGKLERIAPAYNETMQLPFELSNDDGKGI